MSFATTLASLREAAGMTQTQLALKANVPIDTLRRWEQGRHLPQIDAAQRLAKALEVDLNQLVRESDLEQPAESLTTGKRGRPRKQPAPTAQARGRKDR